MKSHEIVNCKIDFNKMYPDVDKKTFEYRKTLEMSPLILPQDIYCLFGNKIKTIDDFKTRYLLGKIKKSLLPTLQTTIHECDSYFTSVIPLWMEQHQESKYLCTLEMKIWLTEHHLEETVAKIREQGSMITADTISNIAYQPFIKSMLLEFRSKLRPLFNTIELYDGKIYVTINNRRLRDIVFWCSPGRFMTTFGQALLLPNFSLPGIKSCLRFQLLLGDQISDIHNLLNKLNKLFSSEYQFLYSHDTEQVYIISFERRKFVYLNGIKSITQYLVPNVLDSNYQCNAELNYFKKIWSWIPMVKFDVNQLNELRKSNDI